MPASPAHAQWYLAASAPRLREPVPWQASSGRAEHSPSGASCPAMSHRQAPACSICMSHAGSGMYSMPGMILCSPCTL